MGRWLFWHALRQVGLRISGLRKFEISLYLIIRVYCTYGRKRKRQTGMWSTAVKEVLLLSEECVFLHVQLLSHAQPFVTLLDCSLPGFSVHVIFILATYPYYCFWNRAESWNWLALYSEKAVAPHSSTLAWQIPWMEEPGRLQSMGSQRVGHDRATSLSLFTFMHWRRKWQPTPVLLPGESQGRVLVGTVHHC